MYQKIPIYLLTTKGSKRKNTILARLKELKLNFNIIYGLNANIIKDQKLLKNIYNSEESIKNTNRKLNFFDIACSYGHLKIYENIVRNNISTAIVMEDDCFPSKEFYKWVRISKNKIIKYDILQFIAPDGFLFKRNSQCISKTFRIYKAATKLTTTTCYQINLKTCRYILKKTNNKVCSTADWPLNFLIDNISQYLVLPFIACAKSDHIKTSTNQKIQLTRISRSKLKKKIPFYNIFTSIYYMLHLPFLFKKNINYDFYREEFLFRKIVYLKNFLMRKYINIEELSKNNSFYSKDLNKNLIDSLKYNK